MIKTLFCCFIIAAVLLHFSCNHTHYKIAGDIHASTNTMYQYGIIDALLAGVFDGYLPVAALHQKGNFGLGTFNRADGELIVLNDTVYKVSSDGNVKQMHGNDSTPFAMVNHFSPDTTIVLNGNYTYEAVQESLRKILNANSMYAIKISGIFITMTARAAAPAVPPYPTLSELLKTNQQLFNFSNASGDCIGFFMPPYMARTNVPGFHFHFLAHNKQTGGHVFAFSSTNLRIQIDEMDGYLVENNKHPDFKKVNLSTDRAAELKRIE